jgi:hypothetical protein
MYTNRGADDIDEQIADDLLAGRYAGNSDELQEFAAWLNQLRGATAGQLSVPQPSSELQHLFDTGEFPQGSRRVRREAARVASRRRLTRRTLTGTSALAVTLAGKTLIGAVAVAAGLGGAHATGVVDIPGLPDRVPPAVEAPPVDVPPADAPPADVPPADAPPADDSDDDQSTTNSDGETGADADRPGVDGDNVSDRATSGEPAEDGKSFGKSVSEEAVDGTSGEGRPGNRGSAADERGPDAPPGGNKRNDKKDDFSKEFADEDSADAPTQGVGRLDENRPDSPPVSRR